MGKNLYIGNLTEAVTETDLKTNFEQAGSVVSVNIIKDRYTGLSRGFGFIEMGTEEEAKEAIKRFDNGELLGNAIKVNEAKPKPDSSKGRPVGGGRVGGPKLGRGWRF
jgi:RNA recognition motif-containing protein